MSARYTPTARRHRRAATLATTALAGVVGILLSMAAAQADATSATPAVAPAGATASQEDTSIRPFHFHATEEQLADLRQRILATRWPTQETVSGDQQGVQLKTIQALAQYWATDYDWRKVEARLNALPQYVTTIDGVDIHFIHVKSKNKNALPIIITHGWPGSIIEQLKVIGPLTDPVAYGGKAEDSFDVIIPSLPGYGFSGQPTGTGWDPQHVARAWDVLMKRLGYTQYVAQGGDWGDAVTEQMAVQAPKGLLGIHTNMPATVPDAISQALHDGKPAPAGLAADERHAYDQLSYFYTHGLAYAQEMANRPQTLYGIEDSPVGLAAWMIDHDIKSYELISRVFAGQHEGLSKDDILDNITLYWLTKTAVSSARLYWENKLAFFAPKHITIPVAVSVFPDELYAAPKSWAEQAFPNLIHYNRLEKGGHFAAWEQPEELVQELRASFKPLR
ncbi:MAG TPA: epoxide hydrolase [Dongiaceae bacterium]|nr:epoxide hydrolase [Dongiaceae bacterium]